MSSKRAILTQGRGLTNGGRPSGWYPDPHDTGGLRYWNGRSWTDHRARLAVPSNAPTPAVCECGVAATGSCRHCNRPFCRTHISDQTVDDRAFLRVWEAWTCHHCVSDTQRMLRAEQLVRCEDVAIQIALHIKLDKIRTITGHKPRVVNLFHRTADADLRPGRHAEAFLIQYDGGDEGATYTGLAISPDGRTVYDVGIPTVGVRRDRVGPKRTIPGYLITEEITLERLRLGAARSTRETWFEFAARVYLRAGARIGIAPLDHAAILEAEAAAALAAEQAAEAAALVAAERLAAEQLAVSEAIAALGMGDADHVDDPVGTPADVSATDFLPPPTFADADASLPPPTAQVQPA
jgi:hypothetical protein